MRALTFDDVSIIPAYSDLSSRSEVDTSIKIFGLFLSVPIISSPMDTVTEVAMMDAMLEAGGLGVHHRYCGEESLLKAAKHGAVAVSPSLGEEFIKKICDAAENPILVVDVAHGDSKPAIEYAEKCVKAGALVVSGNIVTTSAAQRYADVGVSAFRVGVGSGHACSTRVVAGVGVPQLTAISEVRKASGEIPIISDGGVRSSGDIVKAIAAGADVVMLGRLLAGAIEAAGKRYHDGTKAYRGMASQSALEDAGKDVQPEGVEMSIRCNGTVSGILSDLMIGVRAGMAYVGAKNTYELMSNAKFVEITSNGYAEGLPKNG